MNAPVPAANGFTPGGKIDTGKTLKPVKVAVLTISDTRDAESDTSGDLLASRGFTSGEAIRWSMASFAILAFPCAWLFWSARKTMREEIVS